MSEPQPPYGAPVALGPGLRRVLAPNPGPMTHHGTNTYLVGDRALAVIDPGPDDPRHLAAILAALEPGQSISHILVTHAHRDHSPLARELSAACGAPVLAYGDATAGRSAIMQRLVAEGLGDGGEGVDTAFAPDRSLPDGAWIDGDGWRIHALWTPGHFGNHMCFAYRDALFTGDLVMGWASSLVAPPDGDIGDFMASCRRLQGHPARVFHAGHGDPIPDPAARLDWLIHHRQAREAEILSVLGLGAQSASELVVKIYTDLPERLFPAAIRTVQAHLIDLITKGHVAALGPIGDTTRFTLMPRSAERENYEF